MNNKAAKTGIGRSAGGHGMLIGSSRIVTFALVLALLTSEASGALGVRCFRYMVPMRDGTRLATDVYLPRLPRRPVPAVLIRTPYGKHQLGKREARFACRRGFALVVQDMRGRYQSEGSDVMVFHNDGWGRNRDGHDSIRWVGRQCWCDGNVGTWGPSALGIAQNMAAPGAPKALRAQFVMMAFSDMYTQAAYQGGAFRQALVQRWLSENRFSAENLRTVIAHPKYDALWAEVNPEAQAHRVDSPVIFLGGWYDAFLQGTINSFVSIHNHGGPGARGKCRLILGPWSHADIPWLIHPAHARRLPQAANSFRFFDYWLKGFPNGVACDRAVHYYVMGDRCDPTAAGNFWRSAESWPPPSKPTSGYFHADGSLRLEAPSAPETSLCYKYDPNDPVPTVGGQNLMIPKGPMDQRRVESRPDVLLFTSNILDEPVEVTGRVRAKLYVSSDCPDTDFTVKLTDVYPDGRGGFGKSVLLTDGILRARFRESFERESFFEPGKVYELTVDLWSTSNVFDRGHRIRVAVSSSNAPRFDPNPNTGRPFRADDETRVATNRLHLSDRYPSHIVMPVCDGPADSDK